MKMNFDGCGCYQYHCGVYALSFSLRLGEVAKGELWRVFHRLDACQSSARLCRICSKVKYGNFFLSFYIYFIF